MSPYPHGTRRTHGTSGRLRQRSMTVATHALVISASTPVAYASLWAFTLASKIQVTTTLVTVNRITSGRTALAQFGAIPYRGRYWGTRFRSPAMALAPANHRITTVMRS